MEECSDPPHPSRKQDRVICIAACCTADHVCVTILLGLVKGEQRFVSSVDKAVPMHKGLASFWN